MTARIKMTKMKWPALHVHPGAPGTAEVLAAAKQTKPQMWLPSGSNADIRNLELRTQKPCGNRDCRAWPKWKEGTEPIWGPGAGSAHPGGCGDGHPRVCRHAGQA